MLKFETQQWDGSNTNISEIINDTKTGVVLLNVLSVQECDTFIALIEKLKPLYYTDLNNGNGFSLPGMFGQLHKTQPIEKVDDYFNATPRFLNSANEYAGYNIHQFIEQKLTGAFAPFNIGVLKGLLPYSFRVVFPEKGGLFIHKDGNLLPFIHDVVGKDIEQRIQPATMMSWYFTLQQPQEGGNLWVADSKYATFEKDGTGIFKNPEGVELTEQDMQHIEVATPKGSLLMFKGGSYWHKVPPPTPGCVNRITLGGFMALSRNGNEVFYWS